MPPVLGATSPAAVFAEALENSGRIIDRHLQEDRCFPDLSELLSVFSHSEWLYLVLINRNAIMSCCFSKVFYPSSLVPQMFRRCPVRQIWTTPCRVQVYSAYRTSQSSVLSVEFLYLQNLLSSSAVSFLMCDKQMHSVFIGTLVSGIPRFQSSMIIEGCVTP